MTTAPSNYMVKPAKAAIKAFRSLTVEIACNYALDSSVSVSLPLIILCVPPYTVRGKGN